MKIIETIIGELISTGEKRSDLTGELYLEKKYLFLRRIKEEYSIVIQVLPSHRITMSADFPKDCTLNELLEQFDRYVEAYRE